MPLEWATIPVYTAAALPGVTGASALYERIKAEGWDQPKYRNKLWRINIARGGGREFHFSILPADAQVSIFMGWASERRPNLHGKAELYENEWKRWPKATEDQRLKAQIKLQCLDQLEALTAGGMAKEIAKLAIRQEHKIPKGTLNNWIALVRNIPRAHWAPFLLPRHKGRTATADCDKAAWEFFCSFWLRPERPTIEFAYRETAAAAKVHNWQMPSCATFRNWIKKRLDPYVVELKRYGSDAADRLFPAQERDRTALHAMEIVNFDGHKFDVIVEWEDGTKGRPIFLPMQDIYSNKIISWAVGPTESTDLIRLAFGEMVENVAIPPKILADNGRANASKEITGGAPNRYRWKVREEDPLGLFLTCGTKEIMWALPGRGQSKQAERTFRDLSETGAKDIRCAGAWTGNNPMNTPENRGAKAVPIAVFMEVIRDAVEEHNSRPNRDTAVCGKKLSFNEAFAQSFATVNLPRLPRSQRHLWLLAADGVMARSRDGAIYLMKNRYWADFLIAQRGKHLTVRFNPNALHDGVMVFDSAGKHLGDAPCIEKVGYADKAGAKLFAKIKGEHHKAKRKLAMVQAPLSPDELAALRAPTTPAPPVPENKLIRPVIWGNTIRALQFSEPALPELLDDEPDDVARTLRVINGGRLGED
jgi:hypothetical protein